MASPRRLALLSPAFGLVVLAGCSPTSRDFGTGGAGGASSSQGTGGAGSQNSSATSSSGQGGGLPTVCMPGMPPWAGPLCGPPELPCKVITDETLPDAPITRIGPPSIALDPSCGPQVLFDNNQGGFHGFYAVRTGPNAWAVEPTPFEITSSGFAVLEDGTPLVISNDSVVWQKANGGSWAPGAAFDKTNIGNAEGFAREPNGALHLGLYNFSDNHAYYGHLAAGSGTWTLAQVGAQVSSVFPLALSPAGEAHLTYWSSMVAPGWSLYWVVPPGNAELAAPLNSNVLDSGAQQLKLVVTAADADNPSGRPHVLFVRGLAGNPNLHELVAVERNKPGSWSVTSLDVENPNGQYCTGKPVQGQMCNFDYEELGTLGIVASRGGDLRFLYAKIHHAGTSVGQCDPQIPNLCFWVVQTDKSTGEVRAAWLDPGGKPVSASLAGNVLPSSGRVVLDTIGRIHIALLDDPPMQNGLSVRYLEIGP